MDKLFKLTGFIPFILIIFLNAFVDLGHKILIQNTVFKVYDGQTQIILTAIVNSLILLPYLLLFTPAGFISDRYRKTRVMQVSAAAAVGLTLLITLSYYMGWFQSAFALTFLLAVQSAFYSPAKYGYIKELAGKEQLASANGVVQAVTIVAILAGIFVFSLFFERGLAGADIPVSDPEGGDRGVIDGPGAVKQAPAIPGIDVIELHTGEDYLPTVRAMLETRERRRAHH